MERVKLGFKTRIKNELYKVEKKPLEVSKYNENMKKIKVVQTNNSIRNKFKLSPIQ